MDIIFFDRPWPFQLLVLLAIGGTGFGLGALLIHRFGPGAAADPKRLPVAPAFVAVATIFALFLSFLAADIWAQNRQAMDAAGAEHSALQRFVLLAGALGPEGAPALAAHARYLSAVVEGEWGEGRNRRPDPAAAAALGAMWNAAAHLAETRPGSAVAAHLLTVLDDLQDGRERRLAIGASRGGFNSWATVLVLATFTYLAIASVHLDRPAAGRLMMLIFAVATTAIFMFLALHDAPYTGAVRLDGDLLLRALEGPGDLPGGASATHP